MEEPKVGVVLLTHNRLNLLKISLCKVIAQTSQPWEILVVDNNSSDGTKEYLETFDNVKKLYLEKNLGPAGGFHYGIKYFAESTDATHVWLMDDDFFPFDSCLEILLKSVNDTTIVFPYIREKNFASRKEPGWWGVLVPISIINHVGYPRKEFFFWSEDTEYLLFRIREKYNYKGKWISAAKGVHFTKRQTNHRAAWRYYYEVRNMLYMRLYVRKKTARRYYKLVKSWSKLFGSIILKENNKNEKLKCFIRGTYDGVFRNMGKTVDPEKNK